MANDSITPWNAILLLIKSRTITISKLYPNTIYLDESEFSILIPNTVHRTYYSPIPLSVKLVIILSSPLPHFCSVIWEYIQYLNTPHTVHFSHFSKNSDPGCNLLHAITMIRKCGLLINIKSRHLKSV